LIPELQDGVLPNGIHVCTLEEVVNTFGQFNRTDRRPRLTENLARYFTDVRNAQIATAVVIDGSYITQKPEPNDIDLILALRADFDLRQELRTFEYNVQSKRMVKRLYGFDVLPAIDGSEVYEGYIRFFSRVRLNDAEQTNLQETKGVLRIEL
jgi:hypothetical protein